jgi:tRNA (guanine37-N1)-methyltransferase
MIVDVVTLVPGMFCGAPQEALLARARRSGRFALRVHDLRRFGIGPHRQVDDAPYGGGGGMVLMPQPIFDAVDWIRARWPAGRERVVLLSPQGRPLDAAGAASLAALDRLILICGRYEGVDERVRLNLADEEISVGDVVLSGGELPALVVIEAVSRFVPGVLGGAGAAETDSFADGHLESPYYTRPAAFRGARVPDVLLSGDHAAIARWREEAAREATRSKRPDLLDRGAAERRSGA